MKYTVCPRCLVLLAAVLFGQAVAQVEILHPCGLIPEDPRTIPWMVQDRSVPVAPGHASADAGEFLAAQKLVVQR